MATYYSPYASIPDLKWALQGPPTGVARDLVADARDAGVALPPMPGGLNPKQRIAWETLASVDVIAARLERTYQILVRMLGRAGGALCEELNLYNQTALDLERTQLVALGAMRAAGVPGMPLQPPFPKLFVGFGVNAGKVDGEIACAPGEVVRAATAGDASGVRVLLRQPCPGSEGSLQGPPVVIAIVVGASFVVAAVGSSWMWADKWQNVEMSRENTIKGRLQAEYLEKRAARLLERMEKCIAAGGDAIDCLQAADKAEPKDIDALRKDEVGGSGRGVLWWIGLGTILVAGGIGIAAYRRRRRASGGSRRSEPDDDGEDADEE